MSEQDIRWLQRFDHYQKALARLAEGVELSSERALSELEREGFIQRFEYTFELGWNTLKDFLEAEGYTIRGPRDAIQTAFNRGIIRNGQIWMDMIVSRNQSVHAYNEETAEKIYREIVDMYYGAFAELREILLNEKEQRKL